MRNWLPNLVLASLLFAACAPSTETSPAHSGATTHKSIDEAITDLRLEEGREPGENLASAREYVWTTIRADEIQVIIENFDNSEPTDCPESMEIPESSSYTVGDLLYYSIRHRLWNRQSYILSKLPFMRSKTALAEWAAQHDFDFKKMKADYDSLETYGG